ncbi:hypothetical protein [uncultured Methanobrevibacter sp.]|uniref:hypothetical protein n=1 Tax=uncultured Methanobrevibacter sp. TaxID=253161 RepID=UPI0025F5977F|nr:hypothetical protein [uncultured Methanobrevibacter sp.]
MSMLADFEPARLHKRTWVERHDVEILAVICLAISIAMLLLFFALAEPTVAGVI